MNAFYSNTHHTMLQIADLENAPEVENPYSFPLDPFQKHAFHAINESENVLVTAKTGSGKTLVGEYQIKVSLGRGKRVFYTTPIKSLTNQKFHDLKTAGLSVGIMTGDIKFCPNADVVVMTTEILCNLLYKRGTKSEIIGDTASLSIDDVDAVIFDEVHYINNMERGKVWEECLILLPPEIKLILLSATLDQPERFASWLGELKQRPIHLISTKYRIVPLVHKVGETVLMDSKDVFHPEGYNRWLMNLEKDKKEAAVHRRQVANREEGQVVHKTVRIHSFFHRINELVREMNEKEQLPALFFVFSRKNCEAYAAKVEEDLLDSSDVASVKHILSFHLRNFPDLQKSPQYNKLYERLLKGIAFHHSGLLPVLREMVEILFAKGFVKLLFATETFAVGINMPTKTVVMTSFRKHTEKGLRMLKPDEYIQMAGRAGRRGKDVSGTVIYIPEREPEPLSCVQTMMKGGNQTLESKMDFHYGFVLRTLYSKGMNWRDIAEKSFWKAQNDMVITGMQKNLADLIEKRDALAMNGTLLEHLETRHRLEVKIAESVNAERRDNQKLLETWKNTHVGPKWENGWTSFHTWKKLNQAIAAEEGLIYHTTNYRADIEWNIEWLKSNGFVGTLGLMAANVHTGHSLLMAKVYHEKLFHGLDLRQMIGCISLFVQNGKEFPVLYDGGELSENGVKCAEALFDLAKKYSRDNSPESYWTLDASWVDIVMRWLDGEDAFVICRDYELYEGDFVKAMLKLRKVVEEWVVLAGISDDLDMLEKFRDVEPMIIRGIVTQDSLYIRL